MKRSPTQRERVLSALREAGPRGITAVDFLLPYVIDGGAPILGFAARVSELGRSHAIVTAGKRDKCKVFVLLDDAAPTETDAGPDEALFEVGRPATRNPYVAELEAS